MITTHTQLLNALIEKHNLQSYLEIGVQTPEQNFDKINARRKVGVDPEVPWGEGIFCCTSDRFFNEKMKDAQYVGMGAYPSTFDLVFIDGLHHADQVKRDFENSLRCLTDNGFIVIHDVLPENEAGTLVPRIQRQWWGDVYKWAMNIGQYEGIGYKTFNIDNGCMLVWKDITITKPYTKFATSWDWYLQAGHEAMNVTNTVTI